jgi:SAM-dependent methyltransferase
MITTGSLTPSEHEEEDIVTRGEPTKTVYYTHRANEVDRKRIRGMTSFHNKYIKEQLLLQNVLRPGSALLDMSVGQAGDIHKWISANVGFVLGCDIATNGITDKFNGAYKRYMDRVIDAQTKHTSVPPMIFVAADSSKRYSDGSAGIEELDRQILRVLYGEDIPTAPPFAKKFKNLGHTKFEGFDTCAIMFALHYFFRDEMTLNGLLHNIHESLKVGGYFVGCCFDGDSVVKMFRDRRLLKGGTIDGIDGDSKIWSITKQYEGDSLPTTNEGIGMKIDVEFISIGQSVSEYLVSWPFLQSKLAEIGLYLLDDTELAELGLENSSNMFRKSHTMASKDGNNYGMSESLKQFSFLNRWFIFRRKELKNTLPELHTLPPPPPQSLPRPESETEAEATSTSPLEATDAPLYSTGTEVVDMDGVLGLISSVIEPTPILYGPHAGETTYAYVVEFYDGGIEPIVFEYLLEPIPGSDRLRYKGKRAPKEELPLPEGIKSLSNSSNSMPELEAPEAEESVPEEAVAEVPKLAIATGPIYQFYHKSAAKDDLGIKLKYWRRLLSPYVPFVYHDLQDPSIQYPSLEAAWHASRVGIASSKPSARASMFSIESNIHQKAETARGSTEFNPEHIESYLEEGKHYYDLIGTELKLKRAGITFNNDPEKCGCTLSHSDKD